MIPEKESVDLNISLALMDLLAPQGANEPGQPGQIDTTAVNMDPLLKGGQSAFAAQLGKLTPQDQESFLSENALKNSQLQTQSQVGKSKHSKQVASHEHTNGELVRLGKLLKHEDIAMQSPALTILSGDLTQFNPKDLPKLISDDPFLSKAMASNIAAFMSEKRPLGEQIKLLDLPASIQEKLIASRFDLSHPVSMKALLQTAGVDPHSVIADLTRFRNTLLDGGISKFMVEAAGGKKAASKTNNPHFPGRSIPTSSDLQDLNLAKKLSSAAQLTKMPARSLTEKMRSGQINRDVSSANLSASPETASRPAVMPSTHSASMRTIFRRAESPQTLNLVKTASTNALQNEDLAIDSDLVDWEVPTSQVGLQPPTPFASGNTATTQNLSATSLASGTNLAHPHTLIGEKIRQSTQGRQSLLNDMSQSNRKITHRLRNTTQAQQPTDVGPSANAGVRLAAIDTSSAVVEDFEPDLASHQWLNSPQAENISSFHDQDAIEDRIIKHTEFLLRNGGGEASLQIANDDGQTSITVSLTGDDVRIRLKSDRDAIIDAFTDGIGSLDEALAQHHLQLNQVDVGEFSQDEPRESLNHSFSRQQGFGSFSQEQANEQDFGRNMIEASTAIINRAAAKGTAPRGASHVLSFSDSSNSIQVMA